MRGVSAGSLTRFPRPDYGYAFPPGVTARIVFSRFAHMAVFDPRFAPPADLSESTLAFALYLVKHSAYAAATVDTSAVP